MCSQSLLQEWAIRVAEESDSNIGRNDSSSQPVRAPTDSMDTVERPNASVSRSCLGLEGDAFPPSYGDDGRIESNSPSISYSPPWGSPTRRSPYMSAQSVVRGGSIAAEAPSAGGSDKPQLYMRARPLLWSIDDVARDTVSTSPAAAREARDELPPWRRPSIARCAFPPVTVHADTARLASRRTSIPNLSAKINPAAGRVCDDVPPAYGEVSMSPQMCSIPGAYPPSPVAAEAPQRQLPSYAPSPAGYRQRHRSDSWRSTLPGYSSAIQNPHCKPFSGPTNPHVCCGNAAGAGVGLTIQHPSGPYESSILPPSQCPHSGHTNTIIPVYFPPLPPSDTMHITIALQSGCSARNHSATTYGSFLLPLAAAILLLVSLSFGMPIFLSCGASTGSRAPSSSSVHASLVWRAVSTLLSYVFRVLGDRDGKL